MSSNTLSDSAVQRTSAVRPYRVVQWATGNIGTRSLRGVIEHSNLELAGVYVHSADKAGRDAGELCGIDDAGVVATTSIDDVIGLAADCVLYMPRQFDADEVCRILAAGSNIVTTRGEFHYPAGMDPALRERIEAACRTGGTSIHSTGSSPGFVTEALPLVLSSIQRRLNHLAISEFADLSQRNSPGILFDVMGFGLTPTDFDENRIAHVKSNFGPSLQLVAESIGMPLDSVDAHGELATTRTTVQIAAGTLEAGTVAAQRITVSGKHAGRELLSFCATWYCSSELDVDWKIRDTGWHIDVDGDAPLDIDLRFPIPLERMSETAPAYTANRAVNAIPSVCDAAPGIRTTHDLPQIVAHLS